MPPPTHPFGAGPKRRECGKNPIGALEGRVMAAMPCPSMLVSLRDFLFYEMKALKSLCCPFGEEDPLVFFNISVYIPIILYLYKHSYIYIYIYSSRKAA